MNDLKFSIVIPVKNGAATIGRLFGSLITQSEYIGEVIVVDDNSTDKSVQIVKQFMGVIPVKLIRLCSKENNVGNARQTGLDAVTYDWVVFCDADDVMDFTALKFFASGIEYNKDAVGISGSFSEVSTDYEKLYYHTDSRSWLFAKCFKTAFLRENGICFPTDVATNSDTYFMTMFDAVSKLKGAQCVSRDHNCYYWIVRDGSVTHSDNYNNNWFVDSREATVWTLGDIQERFGLSQGSMRILYESFAMSALIDTYYKLQAMKSDDYTSYVKNMYSRIKQMLGYTYNDIIDFINECPQFVRELRADTVRVFGEFVEQISLPSFVLQLEID